MFEREFPQNADFEYSKSAPSSEISSDFGLVPNGRNDSARVEFTVEAVALGEATTETTFSAIVFLNSETDENDNDKENAEPEIQFVTVQDFATLADENANEDRPILPEAESEVFAENSFDEDEPTSDSPPEKMISLEPVAESAENDRSDDGENALHGSENEAPRERHFESTMSGALRHAEFDHMFREWRKNGDPGLRDRMILMNRGLVAYLARRFSDRGEMSEDLMQQGLIGLINALDSFDPDRGARFVTFATPTILGEMRRYLRDRSWGVRVPRRLHELHKTINHRIDALTQQFDRSPNYNEIALSLNLQVEEVIEALEMSNAAELISFDEADSNADGEGKLPISERLGALDSDMESMNDHVILSAALDKLEPRERQVLEAVYFQGHSQISVAKQMKVSQMNVSRLQRRALAHLRELMISGDF